MEFSDKVAIITGVAGGIGLATATMLGEVAEAICFLASDRARYITGETMDVNGGLVMD